jgi:hypothetical protein
MRVLFSVFLLSLIALILTLMAFRRHIRTHHPQTGDSPPLPGPSKEDSLK